MHTFETKEHEYWRDVERDVNKALERIASAYSACRKEKRYAEATPKLEEAKRILGEAWTIISKLEKEGKDPNPDRVEE